MRHAAPVAYFKVLFSNFPVDAEENHYTNLKTAIIGSAP
jgi:hypothetical protein